MLVRNVSYFISKNCPGTHLVILLKYSIVQNSTVQYSAVYYRTVRKQVLRAWFLKKSIKHSKVRFLLRNIYSKVFLVLPGSSLGQTRPYRAY